MSDSITTNVQITATWCDIDCNKRHICVPAATHICAHTSTRTRHLGNALAITSCENPFQPGPSFSWKDGLSKWPCPARRVVLFVPAIWAHNCSWTAWCCPLPGRGWGGRKCWHGPLSSASCASGENLLMPPDCVGEKISTTMRCRRPWHAHSLEVFFLKQNFSSIYSDNFLVESWNKAMAEQKVGMGENIFEFLMRY